MSDETRACDYPEDAAHENGNYVSKCIQCGESFIGHKRRFVCKRCASLPPTPDPRERGVNYAAMMAARDENERDAARVVDAYLADHGVRWSPGAAQMAADLLALEALRAPAPSEAVGFLCAGRSGGWTGCDRQCAMCRNVQTPHPTSAPSEAVAWLIEKPQPGGVYWWHGKRHALAAINEDYNPDHFPSAIAYEFGPVAAEAVRFNSREDADVVIRRFPPQWRSVLIASEHMWVSAHPAPARGVTGEMREAIMSAIEQAVASCVEQAGKRLPTEAWHVDYAGILDRVTDAMYTPDAEGGA